MRGRREENTQATRSAVLKAARRRFGREGYEATALGDIARDARVTTGALYHHFSSKAGLLRAVAEEIEQEILEKAGAVSGDDPWTRMNQAFELLVAFCAAPDVQRIIFQDGPAVLGVEAWREIELRFGFGAMVRMLEGLAAQGLIRPDPPELAARVLLATLYEASHALSRGGASRAQAIDLVRQVLGALRA